MTRLTISERIVLHLSRYDLMDNDHEFNLPWDLTQDGIASSLRITRAHSSIELKKLRERGKVIERQTHIKGGGVRRKSYKLTPAGMEDAERLRGFADKEGIDIMPMLDMKRCDPRTIWYSVCEDGRDVLGLACVLRCPIPRNDLPETERPIVPVDVNGMTALGESVKRNVLSVASEEDVRNWHSAASDYWLDRDDMHERLYHLVCAGRVKDACRLVAGEREKFLYNINDDLCDTLSMIDVPERHIVDVMPVKITVAIESGELEMSETMINILKERDEELGLLYSADLAMKKGGPSDALAIIRSIGMTNRADVNLRMADALGGLGYRKEAMAILDSMKRDIVSTGTVDSLDRVYMQMADVSAVAGDHDSSVSYLTKALGVAGESGKKRIYALLAESYDALGMDMKAKECSLKSR
ncbi:MAG: hypothetical protein LBH69_00820 [Methanomassiliicoccaceae archaeon]|jgi:DNA-binding MarR family transcriptional regulator|nr:hypothetical protein [Methanomassiliicoccaceae archaeon]